MRGLKEWDGLADDNNGTSHDGWDRNAAYEKILAEAHARTRIRIAGYCLVPNHCTSCSGLDEMETSQKCYGGSPSHNLARTYFSA